MQGLDLQDCTSRDLIGTPEEIRCRIEEYRQAGVTSFPALLFTANDMEGFYAEMQWFAEDVMQKLDA